MASPYVVVNRFAVYEIVAELFKPGLSNAAKMGAVEI